jgi:trehalose 6-phosphate synthase
VHYGGREIRVGAFPISIDFGSINSEATGPAVSKRAVQLHSDLGDRQLLLGIDRLDYTKGIPHRLEAFRQLLHDEPARAEQVCLMQVTVPSRESVPEYERLRSEIERLVGDINGEFTTPGGRVPVQYLHRSLSREETYACLRCADVALVSPLRDGMNLVAKEYCACQVDGQGVLVLSEFAGAAVELKTGALLVNPYDTLGMAAALKTALEMPAAERRRRMRRLRQQIARNDIFRWLDDFLSAAFARKLSDFPRLADHVPDVDLSLFQSALL